MKTFSAKTPSGRTLVYCSQAEAHGKRFAFLDFGLKILKQLNLALPLAAGISTDPIEMGREEEICGY